MRGRASALLLEVPEAEPFVGEIRARWDPYAGRGLPAHITLLYPFVPPAQLSAEIRQTIRDLFAEVPAFEFSLTDVRGFGDAAVYLGLRDEADLSSLMERIYRRFPAYPPYGGAHDAAPPHLTVGAELAPGEREQLLRSPAVLRLPLPIAGRANEATLMIERAGRWQVADRFTFRSVGAAASPAP